MMFEYISILHWIAVNIFGETSFLIGFIIFIGLILQKKPLSDIISSTLKGIIGFFVIGAGAGIIVSALLIFQPIWMEVFGLHAVNLIDIMGQSVFNKKYGSSITIVMAAGFTINLFLARFTRFKYIYLTGHMMFWTTMIFAGVMVNSNPSISVTHLTFSLSIIMGLYWTLQPALVQPWVRRITGNDSVALGHTSSSVAILGALVGKIFSADKKSAEELNISKKFGFLRDSNVVTAITMTLLFFIGTFILQIRNTSQTLVLLAQSNDFNIYIYALKQSLLFSSGIAVVLIGVRMFIGEMVPAFSGITARIVPKAKPALDCPILFNYAPNAVVLGFVGAFIGSLIWLMVIGNTTGYVFIPSMIVIFFHAGTAGIFGNVTGGYKGALLAGFTAATVIAWGQYFCVSFLINRTIPDTALWAGDSDMFILAPFISALAKLF